MHFSGCFLSFKKYFKARQKESEFFLQNSHVPSLDKGWLVLDERMSIVHVGPPQNPSFLYISLKKKGNLVKIKQKVA